MTNRIFKILFLIHDGGIEQLLDVRKFKIVAGLALTNSIYNKRKNPKLVKIYNHPQFCTIQTLYHQLIVSENHYDREIAC
jgi:hypothetical protein